MIILVPIEPLEERYSTQWLEWFQKDLRRLGEPFTVCDGTPLTNRITSGSFLDICGTNFYKATQLQELCKRVYNGYIADEDTILFMDAWFPGMEMLAYMRDGLKKKFKIAGCLHAGTWDEFDFLTERGMETWARPLEESWLEMLDLVFVATHFHRELIWSRRVVRDQYKVQVSGFPIFANHQEKYEVQPKQKIVAFPHRLNPEKNPDLFDDMATVLSKNPGFANWKFIKTKDQCKTKSQYYELLGKSAVAVSFADQETWGIAMQEALFAGAIPLVPDKLSYREMYPQLLRFQTPANVRHKLLQIASGNNIQEYLQCCDETREALLKSGRDAIFKMVKHIKNLRMLL
jgi:glycosyltransferase involved in cell wall biosynthesis